MQELVSIITPSYNCSESIGQTIESILSQTYPHWELLITDDGSTDDSVQIIRNYTAKDPRIHLYQMETNSGAGKARNLSINKAQGRYIAFCDSDDLWLPNKLEEQLRFMLDNNYAFTYSSYYILKDFRKPLLKVKCKKRTSYFQIMRDNGIGCLTVIYDCQYFGKIYMPEFRKRQDWALWISLIKKCRYAYGYTGCLAVYNKTRNNSISSNKSNLIKYNVKIYRDVFGFSRFGSYLSFAVLFLPTYIIKKLKISKTTIFFDEVINTNNQ